MKKQKEKNWLMRIFGQGKEAPGDMEIADDLKETYSNEKESSLEQEIICPECPGDLEIVNATLKRAVEDEKKKTDRRMTSPIKRANGGG
jgi:hypothetical protein